MCAERVEVFHVATDDGILRNVSGRRVRVDFVTDISAVADDFVFKFLPALHAALDEDLGTETKTFRCQIAKLIRVIGETRTKTSQSISGSKDEGVSNAFSSFESIVDGRNGRRLSHRNINFY